MKRPKWMDAQVERAIVNDEPLRPPERLRTWSALGFVPLYLAGLAVVGAIYNAFTGHDALAGQLLRLAVIGGLVASIGVVPYLRAERAIRDEIARR